VASHGLQADIAAGQSDRNGPPLNIMSARQNRRQGDGASRLDNKPKLASGGAHGGHDLIVTHG
jgi:hypothetical protein